MLGFSGFSSVAAARVINHLLRTQPESRQRLAVHAGRTLHFEAGPVVIRWRIQPIGEFAADEDPDRLPDLIVHLAPGQLLTWLAGNEEAFMRSRFDGDGTLAADIGRVMRDLDWSPEQDIARFVGDIPAHRLAQAAGGLLAGRARIPVWLAGQLAEYWTKERPLVAQSEAVRAFAAEVDRLRDDTERLEKRLELIVASRR